MSVIYETRGKAREFSELAANLYTGCGHRCVYCYAPSCIRTSKERFGKPYPRKDILSKIEMDAIRLRSENETRSVFLCFTCDPYQEIDSVHRLTEKAIEILHNYHLNTIILTKGGRRAERDFALLTDTDWFGVTLTNLNNSLSLRWEPGAAMPEERISSLKKAHEKGIKTWVSLEPVLYPEVALEIIRQPHRFVDKYKVGTLNYHPHAKIIDWHKFARDVQNLLISLKCDYYIKQDLKKWL